MRVAWLILRDFAALCAVPEVLLGALLSVTGASFQLRFSLRQKAFVQAALESWRSSVRYLVS